MEGMKQFPDKFFELAIVDPPYGIGKKLTNGGLGHGWGKNNTSKANEWDIMPSEEYFNELKRVSANQIIWGGNYFTKHLPPSRSWAIWYKVPYEFTLSQAELAWTSFNKRIIVFERMTNMDRGIFSNIIHPTQKPIQLYEWLLANYAKPGDKILDTHVGSASSLIACHNYGFDYMGFEIDKGYYDKATERLESIKAQISMFIEPSVQGGG
jgi:site-specific DNA-methyltransferase (adenine-specific)